MDVAIFVALNGLRQSRQLTDAAHVMLSQFVAPRVATVCYRYSPHVTL